MTLADLTVPGLNDAEQDTLTSLLRQLDETAHRNRLRAAYYDGKNAVRDLGISTPPNFRRIATVLGWSAKAVDILNRRCKLDTFSTPGLPGEARDALGVDDVWDANMLDSEAPQAGVSSLIHAVAFLIATQGDTGAGEPAALITARDALSGTGLWDRRRRALSAFLSIIDVDDETRPREFVMYLPNLNVSATKQPSGRWLVERRPHRYGVPVEPLVYQPRLGRPFGSSRISRAVMSLHDSALRTVIRSEVSAELYSVPQRVLLGADESAFKNPDGSIRSMWQAILGRVWAVPRDDEGNMPSVQQLPQASQEPHVSQLREWARLFAGETSIPETSLGIGTDANPNSSDAYYASREDLIGEAEGATDGWSPAWRRTMLRALQMRNGWDDGDTPDEARQVRPEWRPHASSSRAAAADAAVKTLQSVPWLAETDLALELFQFDRSFIERAIAERRRMGGSAALRAIAEAAAAGRPAVTSGDAGTGEPTPA